MGLRGSQRWGVGAGLRLLRYGECPDLHTGKARTRVCIRLPWGPRQPDGKVGLEDATPRVW